MKNKTWSDADKQFLIDNHLNLTPEEIAHELGRTKAAIRSMMRSLKLQGTKRNLKEYAVYKGDKFLVLGTAKTCGEFLEVDPATVHFWASNHYHKRVEERDGFETHMIAIKLEG